MKHTAGLIRTSMLASMVLGAGAFSGQLAAQTNPAVEYVDAQTLTDSRPFTLGYTFTLDAPLTVNALGYWNDGKANSHQVGVWDSSGNLLTSTVVTGSDQILGHFQWQTIPDFNLSAGTYTIGGEFLGNDDPFPSSVTGITSIPGYTWKTDEQLYGAGLNYPTSSYNGDYGSNGILMADFSVETGNPGVPESGSTLALLGGALALLVALGRRIRT